ncbi:NLR family CARD domain-containing protein 3-like [Salvelinus alpinus]
MYLRESGDQGNPTRCLNQIYTDLYITEGESGEVNSEHEVRQIETTSRRQATQETPIKYNNIFKSLPGQDTPVRSVMTKGVTGIGKTVSVQKFILDWAEGKANQDIQFIFPFPFRELSLMKGNKHSLIELLGHFIMMKNVDSSDYDKCKVLFVFNGLDECRLPRDFQNNKSCCDVTESTSIDVLLTNLIKGNLLPFALIWITSRPVAANQIHSQYIDLLTETKQWNQKYVGERSGDPLWMRESILSLGKRAFQQLEKGNLIFYEEDLNECGIDIREASIYSGLCTQIFREESGLYQGKVYCFVYLSIQELLAALYVFLTFKNGDKSPLVQQRSLSSKLRKSSFGHKTLTDLHRSAVDQALQSENGDMHLFLRFLLGLSLESNQTIPRGLLTESGSSSTSMERTVKYIKKKIRKNLSPDRCINLFHCLNELNDYSLEEEIQCYLRSGSLSEGKLTCTVSCFVLDWGIHTVNYRYHSQYSFSSGIDHYFYNILVILTVKNIPSTILYFRLNRCYITEKCCEALASALSSNSSHLRELDLSHNNLLDSVVKLLSAGLENLHCQLKTQRSVHMGCKIHSEVLLLGNISFTDCFTSCRLTCCNVTEEGCTFLASALSSNPSQLRELDLSFNYPGDSGVNLFSALLADPRCKLKNRKMDIAEESRLNFRLRKYHCELTLEPNTAHRLLLLSEGNRKVTRVREEKPYPNHPERFDHSKQVLCREGLFGRCYWEADWNGEWVV